MNTVTDNVSLILEGIKQNPSDDLSWLALADALEEDGDARGEATRLSLWLRRRLDHPNFAQWERRLRELVAVGVRVVLPRHRFCLPGGIALEMVLVPPGSFLMGSPAEEPDRMVAEVQHRVALTKGFYLGIYPVTQAQWQAIMGKNPSHFKGVERPVENVSWRDCTIFCEELSKRMGKPFRLPTEAEWEYACRAGTTTPFSFGNTLSTSQANYNGNYPYAGGAKGEYRQKTLPVHSVGPNAFELFQMHGNVREWCSDWYDKDYYARSPRQDPPGPPKGSDRVIRGGGWISYGRNCRSAHRWSDPGYRYSDLGFRVVGEI